MDLNRLRTFVVVAQKGGVTTASRTLHLTQPAVSQQLRLLENRIPIHVVLTEHRSMGVDRPEDIAVVERIILDKKKR